jgi:drug/metabolite transporter (DMT)-like permease
MTLPDGIAEALGALLFFGIGDVVYKRGSAAGVKPQHLLMLQSWGFTPLAILFGLATGQLHLVPGTWWGAGAGFFMWFGFYNFAHSLRTGSISVNAPIFRLSFVLTALLAILILGETLTAAKVAGIGLALLAIWLLLAAPIDVTSPRVKIFTPNLIRVVIATMSVGIGNLLIKVGLHAGANPVSMVVAQAFVVCPLSTIFVAIVDRGIRPPAVAFRYGFTASVVLLAAFILLAEGLSRGEASVIVPIAQMGFAVTAVLGFVVLHERFTSRKAVGLIAAIGALASFASAW